MLRKDLVNYHSLLNRLKGPILLFDNLGTLKYQNQAAKCFFNLSGLENSVKNQSDYFSLDDSNSNLMAILENQQDSLIQVRAKHISGELIDCTIDCQVFELPLSESPGLLVEVRANDMFSVNNRDMERIGNYMNNVSEDLEVPIRSIQEQRKIIANQNSIFSNLPDVQAGLSRIDSGIKSLKKSRQNLSVAAEALCSENIDAFVNLVRAMDTEIDH